MRFQCYKCGAEHDAADLDPVFKTPDVYGDVPVEDREDRTYLTGDKCGVRDSADTVRRHFLRAVMPVPIRGERQPCYWGVWVELDEPVLRRVEELWDDQEQQAEPPLAARLANEIPEYPGSLGLPGQLTLTGPKSRPSFHVAPDTGHGLATVQRDGVYAETLIEWIVARVH
jgi:hypothetical protein